MNSMKEMNASANWCYRTHLMDEDEDVDLRIHEKIWKKRKQHTSSTTVGRWKQQSNIQLDGADWSYGPQENDNAWDEYFT